MTGRWASVSPPTASTHPVARASQRCAARLGSVIRVIVPLSTASLDLFEALLDQARNPYQHASAAWGGQSGQEQLRLAMAFTPMAFTPIDQQSAVQAVFPGKRRVPPLPPAPDGGRPMGQRVVVMPADGLERAPALTRSSGYQPNV